ncbi:hypothetical protein GCM10010372_21490 [Streptomyces tauricus]|uniref:hypothetical protein n=1 Tax=Streptomyces tauricus TaxID=68274 RepID=UPI001674F01A|nr:hypothetical protein [Streptomyces tauricus]GHA21281.1 hypothetical protein GCM10010372_21490 [Streptomyces tauricus]
MTMTMTALEIPVRAAVRAAGLVDVPAVVRLITQSSAGHSEQAQRAMRLVLAHHALEQGQVWVAERDDDGTLLAAAIWLPPGTGTDPPGPHLRSVLSRELATGRSAAEPAFCLPRHGFLSTVLQAAVPGRSMSYWTLVAVCAPDETDAWDRTVVDTLLAPGLRAVDEQDATAVAVTLSARHGDQLRHLGFRGPRQASVAPGASVWLTTRHALVEAAA